ncbi:hypothetical protein NX905_29770, partial [Burkholderia thailandensis]|nr:hypothetical protein [Burkholderia thailandensis]
MLKGVAGGAEAVEVRGGGEIDNTDELVGKQLATPYASNCCWKLHGAIKQWCSGARRVGMKKITQEGATRCNKGMVKKGAACLLGEVKADDKLVMIAEGYATGGPVRMATADEVALSVWFDAVGMQELARY